MAGYLYGDDEPGEVCGVCEGRATAEFCGVEVGMAQISPFHCHDCGATLKPLLPDGSYATGWVRPQPSTIRGEKVTGYYITAKGKVIEMTFDEGHLEFNQRTDTTTTICVALWPVLRPRNELPTAHETDFRDRH